MTAEEELLEQLGQYVRETEQSPRARTLERLCRGQLSASERDTLVAAAATDVHAEEEILAFTPLSEDVRARIAGSLAREAARSADRSLVARRMRRQVRWALPALAAAACLLLWLAHDGSLTASLLGSREEPRASIPEYQLEVRGGQSQLRSPAEIGATVPVQLHPGAKLELVLRPRQQTRAQPSVGAFLRVGEKTVSWRADITRADSGAIRLLLAAPPLALEGPAQLCIVLDLPAQAETRELDEYAKATCTGPQQSGTPRFLVPVLSAPAP